MTTARRRSTRDDGRAGLTPKQTNTKSCVCVCVLLCALVLDFLTSLTLSVLLFVCSLIYFIQACLVMLGIFFLGSNSFNLLFQFVFQLFMNAGCRAMRSRKQVFFFL